MGEVSFNEDDNLGLPKKAFGHAKSGMTISGFVMKLGLAKDQKQADIVLLTVFVVALLLTAYIVMSSGSGASNGAPKYDPTDPALEDMTR